MARNRIPSYTMYNTVIAFSAACAAQRVNGRYTKSDEIVYDDKGVLVTETIAASRTVMREFLDKQDTITDSDREQAELVIQYCKGLSFKILSGARLSDFEQNMIQIANKDEVGSNFDLNVIASLPSAHERGIARKNVESRIRDASGFVGKIGDRLSVKVQVVRSVYSHNWNTHFITGITDDNRAVFFSYRDKIENGTDIEINGTVKAHRENTTQFNRVKVK